MGHTPVHLFPVQLGLILVGLILPAPAAGQQSHSSSAAATAPQSAGGGRGEWPAGQEWASVPVGGLAKEVEVELYGSTRTAAPGGLVVVRYAINSYEDTDERVRLRLLLPEGWVLLDHDMEAQEWLLAAWESIEGEVRVTVPLDARRGERHRIRMLGEVLGEPGGAAVFSYVHVVSRGGLRPGQVGLSGAATLTSNFAVEDPDGARYGGTLDATGKLTRQTTLTLNYRRGLREVNLTNYRVAQEEIRWNGTLRHPEWTLQFGNQVSSYGTVLSGPSVRGRGAVHRRTHGPLVGDLIVAQPSTFSAPPSGHLVRGSVGLSGTQARLSAAFSDFGRPAGGYSTTPRYPEDIDPDSLARLERERVAGETAQRNRVQGAGLDAELQLAARHRIAVRGGWLRLHNAAGDTSSGGSFEAQYALDHLRTAVNARWRQMPSSLRGVHLPGNEAAVDASVKVMGEWRLAGRAYRTQNHTLGDEYHAQAEGGSLGVRWHRRGWRLDLRGEHREWSYADQPTEALSVSLSFGLPIGPLVLNGFANMGEQRRDTLRSPAHSYRGELRWSGSGGSASWTTSFFESLGHSPRLRSDLLGSLRIGDWELAGGAWATRGWLRGGEPGFWTQVGVPLNHSRRLSLGMEHAPPSWGTAPQWLAIVAFRQNLTIPVPFLRATSAPTSEVAVPEIPAPQS